MFSNRHSLPKVLMLALLLQPVSAFAYETEGPSGNINVNPLVRFTRSLAQLDRVSGLCRDIETANYETYSTLIRRYIRNQYSGDVPYWVLSNVKSRIMDQGVCRGIVAESLLHYQYAYKEFVEVTRPRVLPPVPTEAMSRYGNRIVDSTTLGVAYPSQQSY